MTAGAASESRGSLPGLLERYPSVPVFGGYGPVLGEPIMLKHRQPVLAQARNR